MTTHNEEIMFLNRLVEDLKTRLRQSGPIMPSHMNGKYDIDKIDISRLNQAMEVIGRLDRELKEHEV